MNNLELLRTVGVASENYLLTETEWDMIPRTCNNRMIVCKLPSVYCTFDPKSADKYPEQNKLHTSTYDDIEETLYEQAEKHLLMKPNCENLKLIYDMKMNQKSTIKEFEGFKDKIVKGFPQYIPQNLKDDTLGFESRFECGNLSFAFKVDKRDYDLFLNNDVASDKHSSWFFFQIYNTRVKKEYKFTINNFGGAIQMYNSGMQMVLYSVKLGKFMRVGTKIAHYHNVIKKKNSSNYLALSFSLEFPCNYDTVYLSMGFPYTYSRTASLCKYILGDPYSSKFTISKKLCSTINGNESSYLVISSTENSSNELSLSKQDKPSVRTPTKNKVRTPEKANTLELMPSLVSNKNISIFTEEEIKMVKNKQIYVIGARVHPSEFPSSFVMEELLLNLVANNREAEELRSKVAFIVVPMINIDGVIVGNSRGEVSGFDLNRVWPEPSKILHPTIFYYKRLIKNLIAENLDVRFFLDIHAHSKKFNAFIYANPIIENKENSFLHLMRDNCDIFTMADSTFTIQKSKEKSARVVMFKEFGIENSFTLEISYFGPDQGVYAFQQHTFLTFQSIGNGIFRSMVNLVERKDNKLEASPISEQKTYSVSFKSSSKLDYCN